MKRIFIIIFIILFFVLISFKLFLLIYEHRSQQEQFFCNYRLSKQEKELIKDGDIILRHGYGLVSDVIAEQLAPHIGVSHCAIVCKDSNHLGIIHSVSRSLSPFDGVQYQEFDSFIFDSKMNSVIVVRYKSPKGNNTGISQRAKEYFKNRVEFDHDFDINDSTKFYCTELLWKCILNEYGDDILTEQIANDEKGHLRFDAFVDTTKFDIIIDHNPLHNKKYKLQSH